MKFEPIELVLETDEEVECMKTALNEVIFHIKLIEFVEKFKEDKLKQLKTKVISMDTIEEAKYVWGVLNFGYDRPHKSGFKIWDLLSAELESQGFNKYEMDIELGE